MQDRKPGKSVFFKMAVQAVQTMLYSKVGVEDGLQFTGPRMSFKSKYKNSKKRTSRPKKKFHRQKR